MIIRTNTAPKNLLYSPIAFERIPGVIHHFRQTIKTIGNFLTPSPWVIKVIIAAFNFSLRREGRGAIITICRLIGCC